MARLKGKAAIVTGAASGIGKAVSIMFAGEGATVVAVDRDEAEGRRVVAGIIENGGSALFQRCDLRKNDEIPAIKDEALKRYGRIDILVNAAGVLVYKPFLEQTTEDLDLVFETNFRPYALLMQAVLPGMVERGRGSIVNVASVSAVWPELNSYYYGAMKAAVTNLSRNVAKEFSRKGIRINCILPGPINTNMTPDFIKNTKEGKQAMIDRVGMLNRLGEPEDIAYAALYLASDEASFVTGIDLVVDGGVCISN